MPFQTPAQANEQPGAQSARKAPIVGIGASAGGLEAFSELLTHLPDNTGLSFVFIQHLDPHHESKLTELLQRRTRMKVQQASDGMSAEPNEVYIIPPNTAMEIQDRTLQLSVRQTGPVQMPVDIFFRSLAEDQGAVSIGVVLSGSASDGTLGLTAIRGEGGITFAQDPASAGFDGMPRSAIAAGCVDFVLTPKGIAQELVRISRHPYVFDPDIARAQADQEREFAEIFGILRTTSGVDFSLYKHATIRRRIFRRMALHKIETLADYARFLRDRRSEADALFQDLLINVTAFFRDGEAWDFLAAKIIPRIVKGKRPSDPIRVCSVGCASGEEAYSAAILFSEALGERAFRERVKIYATDVDGDALAHARHGAYSGKSVAAVPPKLREKYFDSVGLDRFVVKPDLRRAVIFGRLDLLQDAPISRLDLLICRNTLMYFDAETQARIVGRFHFALNDAGLIFLGKSEMLLSHTDLFNTVSLENRVFSRSASTRLRERLLPLQPMADNAAANPFASEIHMRELAFDAVPVSQLIVDRHGRVVLISAVARATFGIMASDLGKPLQDLEISFRPIELRSLIQQAYGERGPVSITQVKRVKSDGTAQYFDVQVTPLREQEKQPAGAAISFVDVTRAHELQTALHRTNQDLETANEELQSTNEELETMNEELQATNEELETTNDELQLRTDGLNHANAFMHAVLSSLKMGVAIVNSGLEIIAWNETAEHMWGIRAKEAQGQSVLDLGIGLPLDKVGSQIRSCLNGKKDGEETILQAVNRRGKSIKCRVACKAFVGPDEKRGVTVIMEEVR